MSYLIVNIVDGELGIIRERETWDGAVTCCVEMAHEQCPKQTAAEIRKEVEKDGDFLLP
jgi:hypothetical protein